MIRWQLWTHICRALLSRSIVTKLTRFSCRLNESKWKWKCVAVCVAKLTSTPCNTVATLRKQTVASLSCRTDIIGTPVSWSFGDTTNTIFNGYEVANSSHYAMLEDGDRGEFNITLKALDSSDAGKYICNEPGTGQEASAQLVVLGE